MIVHTSKGTITANKATLNNICSAFYSEARYYEAKGYKVLAEESSHAAGEIYKALNEIGYFDNIKCD